MKKIILIVFSICFLIQSSALNVAVYGDASDEKNILEKAFGVDNITYSQIATPSKLVYLVHSNIFDVGIGNITISKERYDLVDFSLPYDSVDTKILVESSGGIIGLLLNNYKKILFLILFIVICANLIWFFERKSNAINDNYNIGIWQSLYYCYITVTTIGFGDVTTKNPLSRFLTCVIALVGIGLFASSVSELTNTEHIKYKISDISDINNLTIGTFGDTFTASWLKNQNINPVLVNKNQKLDFSNYNAFVYDEPILRKIKDNDQKILDFSLNRQYYGVVVNKNNKEILNKINNQILNESK